VANPPFEVFVVGAVNTLFSYLVYAALILIGAHYTLATLISTILGVIFNFFTTGRIVFRSMDNKRFVMFTLVYVFTYLVNILLLSLLVDKLRMDKLLAGALVTLPVALLSYYLNSKLTFRDKNSRHRTPEDKACHPAINSKISPVSARFSRLIMTPEQFPAWY
jgi:GtrA-like protein.